MLRYYLQLAWRSLRSSRMLSVLMMLAVGLGIGASMTMLTVLHVMSADPLPQASAHLYVPQLDPRGMEGDAEDVKPPSQMSWPDAMNLLREHKGVQQAAMASGQVTVIPTSGASHAFSAQARFATADFFGMFHVPFLHGSGWTAADDQNQAQVAVIDRKLADKLYGADRAVGKLLHLGRNAYRIVGVIGDWNPTPHFYDINQGAYADAAGVFLPLQTAIALKQGWSGALECWGRFDFSQDMRQAPCVWLQYWVRLDTPAQVVAYRQYLVNYSRSQKETGRYQRPPNVGLHDLMGWLAYNHVIPGAVQMQTLLALGFLLVCLVNTMALLLVRFLRRSGELGVRRAMGATRGSVFAQLLAEAALLGGGGGAAGLALAWGGLWMVRQQPVAYASAAHLDLTMLIATICAAVVAAVLAAVFPAWRACQLQPARALKLQ
ncbi:ABC transporter permease [Oleiagrimonas sp. C23AA]|uniref:ABC transporter permease n=1 Tax=Oleiagrimonas sp. C23AA TaxID=2719047 RepID=UPI001421DDD3|nr:ABC transporter permease [Oleiagrimonas sp. C23AA]NII12031.1 FtsX-like permease family protein [Oleiagrimonas sp. C23AA]